MGAALTSFLTYNEMLPQWESQENEIQQKELDLPGDMWGQEVIPSWVLAGQAILWINDGSPLRSQPGTLSSL